MSTMVTDNQLQYHWKTLQRQGGKTMPNYHLRIYENVQIKYVVYHN